MKRSVTTNRSCETRRRFVRGTIGASLLGLAGCVGAPGPEAQETTEGGTTGEGTTEGGATADGTTEGAGGGTGEELPEGVSEEEFVSGPVPEPYRTATSQGGEQRDPDDLQTKESVRFQEAATAVEDGFITPGPECGNCAEYVPDVNGDGFGACAMVEGYIGPEDWCVIWQPMEEEGG